MDTGCPGFGTIPPLCMASEQSVNIFCLSRGPQTDLAALDYNENALHRTPADSKNYKYKWKDVDCKTKAPFICQYNPGNFVQCIDFIYSNPL